MAARLVALCLAVLGAVLAPPLAAQDVPAADALTFAEPLAEGPVYVVPVEGTIDNALARYIERALGDAAEADAALVVFHVDTFGGLVAAADVIRKAILDAPMSTVAFVDKNAASAGALISLAADRIVMAPGASIGAATAVSGTGEKAPEKIQSYMRGLMRTTAEANGRDPLLAEAMVDERIIVPGLVGEGELLTLSAEEAVRLGLADAMLPTTQAVLASAEVAQRPRVEHRASRAERILRFFGSPVIQSILMLMMMGGLYFELQTPGLGFPGAAAVTGAALFFAPHYMLGLVESWELVLFAVGVLLLLAEVFVIPGFGVAGVSGLLAVVVSLGAATVGNVGLAFPDGAIASATVTLAITLVLLVALMYSLSRYLPESDRFSHLVLAPELTSGAGYTSATTRDDLVGQTGVALSTLRPAGTADLGGDRVDVVTQGDFIPAGEAIEVVTVRGARVEVRRLREQAAATSAA